MKAIGSIGRGILYCIEWYIGIGFAYGLWALTVLQFRECGIFSACPQLPTYSSRIVNVALTVLPDVVPYSILIAIGRGITWLPNLYLSLVGYQGQTFLDWLMVRDVLPMADFYRALSGILP